jgi:sec-independent protein translocase protein TatB
MFDIGFMELVLIAVVALIVVGPERLPGAIRTTTLWIGRAKRSFQQVKTEIEREINADEIRRQLHNESILAGIEKARKQADSLSRTPVTTSTPSTTRSRPHSRARKRPCARSPRARMRP